MPVDLMKVYDAMYSSLGPQHWWPARTRTEVIVGAILTQNTAWPNVEAAIKVLRAKKYISLKALGKVPINILAGYIRSSGYFNIKAKRLKNFVGFINKKYKGSLSRMFSEDVNALRINMLEVNGIGPETADSILLYAGDMATFVVDAYTKRIFSRHVWLDESESYEGIRQFFMSRLRHDTGLFGEYHALIVNVGKNYCLKRAPRCEACPLKKFLPAFAECHGC